MYLRSLHSEWLKTKRSASSWLCLIGGFFIPLIYMIFYFKDQTSINHTTEGNLHVWMAHFDQLWQNMAVFLLPMGLILVSSLITQVEYRNNTWKQLHTTPQSYTMVFVAKLSVLMLMTMKFFIFFNIGIISTGYIPCLLFDGAGPRHDFPLMHFLQGNLTYFIACLPVMALQFLVSMNFKNFLVPIGIGFLGLVGTIIGMQWEHIVISPYAYCTLNGLHLPTDYNLDLLAILYFLVLIGLSYWLYLRKSEKG